MKKVLPFIAVFAVAAAAFGVFSANQAGSESAKDTPVASSIINEKPGYEKGDKAGKDCGACPCPEK